ncbi:MAG: molybdopterin-dependent oxidoreductase [Solirubrobacteraceae bacterium]
MFGPPPPGPFRPGFWRSPLRGPWLTSLLGAVLLIAVPLIAVTGYLSNAAYNPRLGENALGRNLGLLDFYLFPWPTHPAWLYAFTQGLHVTLGLAAFPILLAKLWSVIPKLFEWPPLRSPAHALERLSLLFLVGGGLFEFITGILDIQYAYLFGFFFTDAHYYGAWVFSGALAFHVLLKFGTMRSSLRTRGIVAPLREKLTDTRPEPGEGDDFAAPSMTRRALVGTVGAGSLLLLAQGAGDSIGGPLRRLALFGPRERFGGGPNGFAVNRTASSAGIAGHDVGGAWRLTVRGAGRSVSLSRAQLEALPSSTHELPIACVEGWSTTQRWRGVPLRDLARLVEMRGQLTVDVSSIEQNGVFAKASLGSQQISDARTLLALSVNGEYLSLDHGYPARVIGPALPGVHCTKWVSELRFREAQRR